MLEFIIEGGGYQQAWLQASGSGWKLSTPGDHDLSQRNVLA